MSAAPELGTLTKFQFTPLREGRPLSAVLVLVVYQFQFTPLREGRRIALPIICATPIFQFTPLREGRLYTPEEFILHTLISIHAPAGGATTLYRLCDGETLFQFTPLREGRQKAKFSILAAKIFQFTPLREGRHDYQFNRIWAHPISIHAPAGGATLSGRAAGA